MRYRMRLLGTEVIPVKTGTWNEGNSQKDALLLHEAMTGYG